MASSAWAGLPRHCFFVTDMHSSYEKSPTELEFTELYSDLPTLMALYEPGMIMSAVVALEDAVYDKDNVDEE